MGLHDPVRLARHTSWWFSRNAGPQPCLVDSPPPALHAAFVEGCNVLVTPDGKQPKHVRRCEIGQRVERLAWARRTSHMLRSTSQGTVHTTAHRSSSNPTPACSSTQTATDTWSREGGLTLGPSTGGRGTAAASRGTRRLLSLGIPRATTHGGNCRHEGKPKPTHPPTHTPTNPHTHPHTCISNRSGHNSVSTCRGPHLEL